jgi:3-hydroxyisobutyrate dehydrogenase-like beta-hydroxyacid dehydrogenase
VLGETAGLDPALVFDVIAGRAGSSHMFQIRGPMMLTGRYDLHCPTPLFTAGAQFYHAGVAQGRSGQDTGAVCTVLEGVRG